MKKLTLLLYFFISVQFISCNTGVPSWIENKNHALSPDGKTAVYESKTEPNRYSAATWSNSSLISGGAGIFDIVTEDSLGFNFKWISETEVLIEYPSDAEILRQLDSTFFVGRTTYFQYAKRK